MRRASLILGFCWLLAACSGDSQRTTSSAGGPTTSATLSAASTGAIGTGGAAGLAGTRTATVPAAAAAPSVTAAAAGQGPTSQEACRVVTKAEVEMATGLPLQDGTFTPGGLGGTCIYEQQRTRPADLADRLYVQPFTSQSVYAELRAQASGAQDVPGLGDRAYANALEVAVLKGNRGVYISWDHVTTTPGLSDAQRRDRLIALARTAVARL